MSGLALALVCAQLVVFLGGGLRRAGRSLRDWRPGQSRRFGPIDGLFLMGDILYVLGPLTALGGVVGVASVPTAIGVLGVLVFLASAGLALIAQRQMGSAWAPVGASNHLITGGAFASIRHPIYTGLVGMSIGVALMIPTPVTIGTIAIFAITIELQARLVEERYLLGTQPDYARYSATTGRFLPRIGRLRS
jgi:protein-S-isoprenylcysteine O-methyltransferase Ste14